MFIREVKKQGKGQASTFFQYNLVQSARVDGKARQTIILYLGSDILLKDKANREVILSILKAKIFGQEPLFPINPPKELLNLAMGYFEKYLIRHKIDEKTGVSTAKNAASIPPLPQLADFHNVDIKDLSISDVKSFGAENLCKQVLDKLQLRDCFAALKFSQENISKALISIAAKAIFSEPEYKTAQILAMNSELAACFKYESTISHKHLYAVSDLLYSHKEAIDKFLYSRITDMFKLEDKIVIFDISNTYFESRKADSKIAKYGRSKEKRNDCPIVVFTGVINAQGFIRHSKIYEGNKPDRATLKDMVADLSKYSPPNTRHTIVMDAGIADEENLEFLRAENMKYVCVSRKQMADHPVTKDTEKVIQMTDRDQNKVELAIFKPENQPDTWMYVQSEAKRLKEQSMDTKLMARFEENLEEIKASLTKPKGDKKIEKIWERIGRAKEKHSRVSGRYQIDVQQKEGQVTQMDWSVKESQTESDKSNGVYYIRTNYEKPTETELWDIYNTIREVENTFRCLKTDLNIRPVHHQLDSRIEAHIYLTILAYQLVNTILTLLKAEGITLNWCNVKRIMATQTIQTLELPTDKKRIHLRKPSRPIKEALEIYQATKTISIIKEIRKNVVYH
jgi:hypothetical protein